MAQIPLPADESGRLSAITRLGLNELLGDEDLAEITRIAAAICRTPMALVTVIEQDEQVFKAQFGVHGEGSTRDASFCTHTILGDQVMEIPDAHVDPRFQESPLVIGPPHVTFYAGAPLVTSDGYGLGAVCVMDRQPRHLDEEQKHALTALSRHVVAGWELRAQARHARQLVDRAGTVEKMRDEFVTLVRHELRTPLTSIRAYLQLLADPSPLDAQTAQELLDVISHNSDRLLKLIDNLLLVARLSTAGLELYREPLDLSELVTRIGNDSDVVAQHHHITLTVQAPEPVLVFADRARLGQAIDHLVFNALKFTPAGGQVWLRVGPDNTPPGPDADSTVRPPRVETARVEIADTGVGISPEDQTHLFDPFYRAEAAREQQTPGSGLGMTIIKAIVDAHDGTITVDSEPGRGSVFRISLPTGARAPGREKHTSSD